ncbi:glutathionylspermidine synthase family protein [Shewanella sp. JM162201]|uniref:Glutathionylspermidine synthase family protein n=1 Tax=Shewanella jiangmenensis TaxID=2837387 RepID=A0ABS5V806_9GAMM|nr:glutathionylspermidine synthase family protein [Shewanella jiangmenensis]MBT1446568.1 glutathionylspermidine synthase family protein [Shewanella jiangmenensis]
MERIKIAERPHWRELAKELGFVYHTFDGEPYWDETAYYRFNLRQIEQDLEDPTEELHQMALSLVPDILASEQKLIALDVPEYCWQALKDSWDRRDPHLYGRFDLCYNGKGPAKLLELNYDTPTSIYESGFFQWIWLEDMVRTGLLPQSVDQFNSLQEKLELALLSLPHQKPLYFSCIDDRFEDRGNVDYLMDIAMQAGVESRFIDISAIGLADGQLIDMAGNPIESLFKLYPWEFMVREDFGPSLLTSQTRFIEPPWKMLLSNKGLLPLLWQKFPGHPNLLEAHFETKEQGSTVGNGWVRKPLYSREGANISLTDFNGDTLTEPGPYTDSGFIRQALAPLPCFDGNFTLIGSWVVGDSAAGIGLREDMSLITKDSSRFLPHIILD